MRTNDYAHQDGENDVNGNFHEGDSSSLVVIGKILRRQHRSTRQATFYCTGRFEQAVMSNFVTLRLVTARIRQSIADNRIEEARRRVFLSFYVAEQRRID